MSRSLLYLFCPSFLTISLTMGCSHHCLSECTSGGQEPLPASILLQGLTEPEASVVVPGTAPVVIPPAASPAPAPLIGGEMSETRGLVPTAATMALLPGSLEPPPPVSIPVWGTVPTAKDGKMKPVDWLGNRVIAQRGCTDWQTHPAFAHDMDHRWLVGLLGEGPDGGLTLRYASVSDDDSFNGHVLLTSSRLLTSFRPGQLVRVEGQVTSLANGAAWTTYRVDSIHLLQMR
jgi:hypothetical protein